MLLRITASEKYLMHVGERVPNCDGYE